MKTYEKNSKLKFFKPSVTNSIELPLVEATISAGFPSPADDYSEARLDLNKELISNQSATFYARVRGDSMTLAGISDGDLLIIDKSKTPLNGSIVVCLIDGEFTVKRLQKKGNQFYLMPENDKYQPIKIKPENDVTIWGVVTYTIKKHI
jgi:DNA polymerase V